MRRALATAGLLSAVALGSLGVTTAPALAAGDQVATGTVLAQATDPVDADPVEDDGNTDSGKWGLGGLLGLFGLFGYKKYRDYRTTPRTTRDNDLGPGSTRL